MIIPFIAAVVYRRLPKAMDILSAVIAMAGIGFLTLKGSSFNFTKGELLVLAGGVSFAFTVVAMDFATKNDDPLRIGIIHMFFIGLFSLIASFIFEGFKMPTAPAEWGAILYLALVCGAIGFTLQPVGQKYTTPERSGLYVACNPLAAAVMGVIFLGERLTPASLVGGLLVLVSIFLPAAVSNGLFSRGKEKA